jgi:hypothetical protein
VSLLAEQMIEDTFWLPRRLVGEGTVFMLKVAGDSMSGAGIADGDLVVVRQQPVAENGEIVVAAAITTDGEAEATVKTLQRVNGHVWLMPQTPPTRRSPMRPPSSARSWPCCASRSDRFTWQACGVIRHNSPPAPVHPGGPGCARDPAWIWPTRPAG